MSTQTTAPKPAPQELSRLDALRGMRISTWEASCATIHGTLTAGAFLTGFALWLGADSLTMGLLTAIPTFAGLVQIVASYFAERRSERKKFTAWFSVAGRSIWLLILLLPFLLPRSVVLIPFLLCYTLSFVLLNVPAPAWMSWMSDLVPANHRGRYFAQRNMIAGIVGMVIGLPAAWFLDFAIKKSHHAAEGFGTLFGIAVAGGLASFALLLRQPEPHKRHTTESESAASLKGILDYYRAPFADANFRRLILFNAILSSGQFFAAPFFTVYALQRLHLDYTWLQILATVTSIASLACMPLWGLLADKVGNRALLAISVVGVITIPFAWIGTNPHHPALTLLLLVELNIAGGLFWTGVGLTQFNLLINSSPADKTSVYVATMAAITGLVGGTSPLIGGVLMHALEGWHATFLGVNWTNFQVTFLIAALLRVVALFLLRPVSEAHATSTIHVLQQLSRAKPQSWIHMRRLQDGNKEARLRATEALGETRTQLAVGELQTALADPSSDVREEAARALGVIGDPASVPALIASLNDPVPDVVEASTHALGQIGDREATPAVVALLLDEHKIHSQRVRLAAARALGAIGGADAADALLQILGFCPDEELEEIAVRALGAIGDQRAVPTLVEHLSATSTSRGLCLALIRSLGELGDRDALPALQTILRNSLGDPVFLPPLADALARLQDTSAILPLVDSLSRLPSEVARKQVAYSIGMLLDAGQDVYQLLSREEYARDAAVSKLIADMQKALRSLPSADPLLRVVLERYTQGNLLECLRAVERVARRLFSSSAVPETPNTVLCRTLLQHLMETPDEENVPLEAVLLAFTTLYRLAEASTKP